MRSYQLRATVLALACLTSAGSALAQNPSTTPTAPAQEVPTPPADNPTFLDGLRRVGVMAGQVVECSADADKQDQISRAMELANLIAIHFGLKAAFTFTRCPRLRLRASVRQGRLQPSDRRLETDPSQVPQQVRSPVMKKLLIYVVPVALVAAHASAAPPSGWGGIGAFDLAAGIGAGKRRASGAGAASWRWRRRRQPGQCQPEPTSTGAISTAPTFSATYRPTVTSRRTAT